jgi:hypothetical protein
MIFNIVIIEKNRKTLNLIRRQSNVILRQTLKVQGIEKRWDASQFISRRGAEAAEGRVVLPPRGIAGGRM